MSNKTMTLTDISKSSKQFKDTHTLQVGGFKDTQRQSKLDLILERLDKIEQFDQYVLDVFKRNNLK